jgi:ethanolamine utilization protein EutM
MQKALGLIETIGLVTAIEAADAAVKAANVVLLGYENTKGGGKITVKIVGDVGAVQAAVSAGTAAALRIGKVYGYRVIPRPHEEINALIRQVDRGQAQEQPDAALLAPAPETTPAAEAGTPPLTEPPVEKQCIAITKSGERCKLSARPGSEYCSMHRKLDPSAG